MDVDVLPEQLCCWHCNPTQAWPVAAAGASPRPIITNRTEKGRIMCLPTNTPDLIPCARVYRESLVTLFPRRSLWGNSVTAHIRLRSFRNPGAKGRLLGNP